MPVLALDGAAAGVAVRSDCLVSETTELVPFVALNDDVFSLLFGIFLS